MNRLLTVCVASAAMLLSASLSSNAEAGLFSRLRSSCCAPQAACAPAPSCSGRPGLLAGLRSRGCGGGLLSKLGSRRSSCGGGLMSRLGSRKAASCNTCSAPAGRCGCSAPAPTCNTCAAPASSCGCSAPAPACNTCAAPASNCGCAAPVSYSTCNSCGTVYGSPVSAYGIISGGCPTCNTTIIDGGYIQAAPIAPPIAPMAAPAVEAAPAAPAVSDAPEA